MNREPNVLCDLAQQYRRNIATGMDRNGGKASVSVPKLFVRAAYADFPESQAFE
jgi:hypothetical protein